MLLVLFPFLFPCLPGTGRVKEEKKRKIGKPSVPCRTVETAQVGEERSDLTEEEEWKKREREREGWRREEEEEAK